MNVAILVWNENGALSKIHTRTLKEAGHQVTPFRVDEPIPSRVDAVFVDGPYGSLVPLTNQLLALPVEKRPFFLLWMSEQFWNPRIPIWLGRPLSQTRTALERRFYRRANGVWRHDPRAQPLLNKATRFRYFGDALWLQSSGLRTALFVKSDWTKQFLLERGVTARVAYNGYTPAWGHPLGQKRDIDVLWLGSAGSLRRERLLKALYRELRERGIQMMVVDGKEHPPVHGTARTTLLNRTKIVLNLLRQPWDSNYLRYLLAMSNGAMVVGEPTYAHAPFQPGSHLVTAPIDQLADQIAFYCRHETERAAIAQQAFSFITTRFTLQQSFCKMLAHIEQHQRREVALEA